MLSRKEMLMKDENSIESADEINTEVVVDNESSLIVNKGISSSVEASICGR